MGPEHSRLLPRDRVGTADDDQHGLESRRSRSGARRSLEASEGGGQPGRAGRQQGRISRAGGGDLVELLVRARIHGVDAGQLANRTAILPRDQQAPSGHDSALGRQRGGEEHGAAAQRHPERLQLGGHRAAQGRVDLLEDPAFQALSEVGDDPGGLGSRQRPGLGVDRDQAAGLAPVEGECHLIARREVHRGVGCAGEVVGDQPADHFRRQG